MNILVIEDENGLREALIKSLSDEGYQAEGAEDGDWGLDLIRTDVYDLIILDIMLPKRSGLDILSTIRNEKNTTPVILLTARSGLNDKVKGMDLGADDYLTKPFEMEELFARIRMISRRTQNIDTDHLMKVSDLTLNIRTYELSCTETGRVVKLGMKEFRLMEYMMANAGAVLSREQITEKIWGFDSEAEYNNVDVYISFIRKKISFLGATVRINAIRGVGYTMNV